MKTITLILVLSSLISTISGQPGPDDSNRPLVVVFGIIGCYVLFMALLGFMCWAGNACYDMGPRRAVRAFGHQFVELLVRCVGLGRPVLDDDNEQAVHYNRANQAVDLSQVQWGDDDDPTGFDRARLPGRLPDPRSLVTDREMDRANFLLDRWEGGAFRGTDRRHAPPAYGRENNPQYEEPKPRVSPSTADHMGIPRPPPAYRSDSPTPSNLSNTMDDPPEYPVYLDTAEGRAIYQARLEGRPPPPAGGILRQPATSTGQRTSLWQDGVDSESGGESGSESGGSTGSDASNQNTRL
ncbi:hypothetical protein HDE_13089 [Halotydeus destructor]|nr:hypothetical protein HDE_13089 [Halotydeus destructor]